ncbi:MAG: N-acetylgalactosamine 6-sulfate sulfatase, partial [Acidobacteria bacterium]|nr:N-acetylgalactosamine 6-sulfate sulfatase [Acidobacteriota bacterium]
GEQRAVRRGHWKLTLMPGENPFLADLKADPGEKTNLAGAHLAVVSQLRDALARWEKDVTPG